MSDKATLNKRLAETVAWLDALYGDCGPEHGSLVIISQSKRRILKAYPLGSPDQLVEAAKKMQSHEGCYAKINPMDIDKIRRRSNYAIGNQSEVQTIVSLHLDVDAGKEGYLSRNAAKWAINQMPLKASMIINSQHKKGGFHAYWLLQPHLITDEKDRSRCHAIAKRWQDRLKELCVGKLDSTSNLDRVLRCVGVPRVDGDLVTCESCDFGSRPKLEDVVSALGAIE